MKILEKKHPLAIRWFHWINFPVLMIMIWSGIMIYWAVDDNYVTANGKSTPNPDPPDGYYQITIGKWTPVRFFPPGFYTPPLNVWPNPNYKALTPEEKAKQKTLSPDDDDYVPQKLPLYSLSGRLPEGMAWHFLFAWFFAINGIAYVLYTALSGEWRHLLPNRNTFKEAWQVMLHDLFLSKKHPPRRKFNGAQQLAYTGVIVMGVGSLFTGLAIFRPVQFAWIAALFGGYPGARLIHFALTIGYVLFFLVHITQVVRAGWNNFRAMVTGVEVVQAPATVAVSHEGAEGAPVTAEPVAP
ncbi:MAG TPA: cytochrome b/b6 domain-containing protein [Chthonomonadaceae bacterium]|nr:cytochrome b/b6 domain-containing protein [Chthonomonadaceae bacterium]